MISESSPSSSGLPERRTVPAAPRRKKAFLYFFSASLLLVFSYYVLVTARNAIEFLSVFEPDEENDGGEGISDSNGGRRADILKRLNEEIDQESKIRKKEETRLLSRLDQLLRSIHSHLLGTQEPREAAPPSRLTRREENRETPVFSAPFVATSQPDGSNQEKAFDKAIRLALAPSLPQSSQVESRNGSASSAPRDLRPLITRPLTSPNVLYGEGAGSSPDWLRRLEPLEGYRARGMALRIHRILALEGLVDATSVGETDSDLQDFGIRSVHALTFLQGKTRLPYQFGGGRIDSGYPRSFGIGLNLRLSPTVNFLFDYSNESSNDHFIEYRENWESSLVADYSKIRPDREAAIHSFFFGLRYLHDRNPEHLIPLQTGFFYSTNMANEPVSSDVSLGFSIGGGLYRRGMRLSMAYRLRIWENPVPELLQGREEDFTQKISNQFLFSLNF